MSNPAFKRKALKAALTGLLACALLTPLLTGCAKTGKVTNSGDKIMLTMMASIDATLGKVPEMEIFRQMEEKTGIKVEWQAIPASNYRERLNVVLAANELPDAFFGVPSFNIEDANRYGPQGVVLELGELIDQYAPNYKKVLSERPIIDRMTTSFDGKKYLFGTVIEKEDRNFPSILMINKIWLDNLGLQVPETVDDFFAVLKAFRDHDPNGNGEKDEIPLTFLQNQINGLGQLFGAYGRVSGFHWNNVITNFFLAEDGKVIFTADKEEFKTGLKEIHRFFAEGLFDKEGFTQDKKQFDAKMRSEKAIVGACFGSAFSDNFNPATAKEYIAIPMLKGPSGSESPMFKRINNANYQAGGFAITSVNKYPAESVQWIDCFYDAVTGLEAQYGPIGTVLKKEGDNQFGWFPTPDEMVQLEWFKQMAPFDLAPKYITKEMYNHMIPYEGAQKEKMDILENVYKNAAYNESLPSLSFAAEETQFNQSYGLDIINLVQEMQARCLLNGNVDTEWNEYIPKLKRLKLDEFIAIMQAAYDKIYQ